MQSLKINEDINYMGMPIILSWLCVLLSDMKIYTDLFSFLDKLLQKISKQMCNLVDFAFIHYYKPGNEIITR